MNTRILLSVMFMVLGFDSIGAQTETNLQTATLYNLSAQVSMHTDNSRSSVNFETGQKGHSPHPQLSDFDLTYGGLEIKKDGKVYPDWLRVTDPRSMMVELGKKEWQEIKATPPFPKPKKVSPPLPLSNRPMVIDVSAGSPEVSPYRQFIAVQPGHVYLMRLVRDRKVIYVMFRVESLTSRDNCVLSWKLVKPPNVDDNEKF